ncbi:lysophospholipid acyltransferase family protein [Desulfocurvibacter africanus]
MHMKTRLLWWLACLGQRMSIAQIDRAGDGLGRLFWLVLRSRRRLATKAIQEHLGLGEVESKALAYESFRQNCRSFLELLYVPKLDKAFLEERCTINRPDIIAAISKLERPIVLVSGHIGAWEFCSTIVREILGITRVTGIARKPKSEAMHVVMMRLRERPCISVIPHRNAARQVLRRLKNNEAAGFVVDHNTSSRESIFLPFLGEVAAVNKGPAILAVGAKALVLPLFLFREPGGRYRIHVEDPLDTTTIPGDREQQVQAVTEFYNEAVERQVRQHPEQWFWMHKRWKTKPDTETDSDSQATPIVE